MTIDKHIVGYIGINFSSFNQLLICLVLEKPSDDAQGHLTLGSMIFSVLPIAVFLSCIVLVKLPEWWHSG